MVVRCYPCLYVLQIVTTIDLFSVFVFFIALLLFSFQNATTKIRVFMGATSGIVIILVICCIASLWDPSIERDEFTDIPAEDDSEQHIT